MTHDEKEDLRAALIEACRAEIAGYWRVYQDADKAAYAQYEQSRDAALAYRDREIEKLQQQVAASD